MILHVSPVIPSQLGDFRDLGITMLSSILDLLFSTVLTTIYKLVRINLGVENILKTYSLEPLVQASSTCHPWQGTPIHSTLKKNAQQMFQTVVTSPTHSKPARCVLDIRVRHIQDHAQGESCSTKTPRTIRYATYCSRCLWVESKCLGKTIGPKDLRLKLPHVWRQAPDTVTDCPGILQRER